ncbi:glycosyltransferase family 9 protein [Nanoarchaeota archaeon]
MNRINRDYMNIWKELPILIKTNLVFNKKLRFNSNASRILIINNCLIGDFINSIPAIQKFITTTKAEIDLVVSTPLVSLIERMNGVKNVFPTTSIYKRETETESINELCSDYDQIILIRMNNDSYDLLKKTKFKNLKTPLVHYVKFGANIAFNQSYTENIKQYSEYNFDVINENGAAKIDFKNTFTFRKEDSSKINTLKFMKKRSKKIIIHTGTNWQIRSWENSRWAELLKRINKTGKYDFIFVGGSEEDERNFQEIQKQLDFEIYSTIKQLNLRETTLLIEKSDFFIGIDSGPRHLADMVLTPGIVLQGPGPKMFKPLNGAIKEIDKSDCRCTLLLCHRKVTCMQKISVDEVFRIFKSISLR